MNLYKKTEAEVLKVYEENKVLHDVLKRRTTELKLKNRELEVEAALEQTRTQSMLMQNSDELDRTIQVFHEQLHLLGIDSQFSYLWLPDEEKATHLFWATWFENQKNQNEKLKDIPSLKTKSVVYPLDKTEPSIAECYVAWESGETVHVNPIPAKGVKEYFETWEELLRGADQFKAENYPDGVYYVDAYMKYGCFGIMIKELLSEDEKNILSRFTKAFEQVYTRFLDLQKAEAQAREAKIEASLEKVRTVALSMKESDNLLDIVKVLYEQLLALGFSDIRNAIIDVNNEDAETFMDYDYSEEMGGTVTLMSYNDDPTLEEQLQKIATTTDGFSEMILEGQQLQNLIEMRRKNGEAEDHRLLNTDSVSYILYAFGNGAVGISNFGVLTENQKAILDRFRNVFTFAYKRYSDLAQAEAQTREAQIEVSLEKVRSRTMAMQHPNELEEVVTVVVEKLMDLGVVLDANGVIICTYFKDNKDVVHWMASPDFTFSGRYLLPYFDHPIFNDAWNSRESGDEYFSKNFTVEEKNSFFKHAFEHSDYRNFPDEFKEWVFQNDKHSLSFAWEKSSAILVPSHTGITPNESQIEILKRFAKVFEQAYIRFLDLQVKEEQAIELLAEKERLEITLLNLQATQTQLIQSEKMASLGELTAGIAHEIQNPLNFVNNFSEVSNELIDEMNEEIEKGDLEEAKLIANDIKQNLEKINHHGKRADAIVKGMLQHSKKSTAEKEPTDINKLADEYLRLAYHGLRAKDKTFNATLETEFDESIGLVKVIPQDLGRVILNLITNAFYAVNEKKSASKNNEYKPTVSVYTKQVGLRADSPLGAGGERGPTLPPTPKGKAKPAIEISITDNGNGIPKHVLDKIFQPFFTTKPTGQGTGLGLSMAYDIITKGHNGELGVETKEGEGTTFIIQLPL